MKQSACFSKVIFTIILLVIFTAQSTNAQVDAGENQPNACATTHLLAVTPGGIWSTDGGAEIAEISNANTFVFNLDFGDNTFTWTVGDDDDDVIITNNEIVAFAGNPQQTCNENFTLVGSDPDTGTGKWTFTDGIADFDNDEDRFTDVVVGRGDNTLVWTITNGECENSSEVIISHYGVVATVRDEELNICRDRQRLYGNNPNSQLIETPNIPATGTWETDGPGEFDNENDYRTYVRELRLDLNTLTWTIENEYCSASIDMEIYNNTPSRAYAGSNETFCGIDFVGDGYEYSSDFTLDAEDPDRGEGHWTIIAGGATFIDLTTTHNAQITDLDYYAQMEGPDHWNMHPTVNTFRWTVEYKNCSLDDEVTITNAAPYEAQAGPNQLVCWDEANLNAICHGSGAQEHWWDEEAPGASGAIINNINEFNSHVEDVQTGTTTFRWYKRNRINGVRCTVYDDTEITRIGTTGTTTAGPNKAVCKTLTFLEATPKNTVFPSDNNLESEWAVLQGGGDFENINSNSTEVTNLAYQTNIFRWTITNNDMDGCIATADVEILNGLPSTPDGGENQVVCENHSVLRAVRPTRGEGVWEVGTGGGSISATSCVDYTCTAIVTNLQMGPDNTVDWTVTNYFTDPGDGTPGECSLTDIVTVQNRTVIADQGTDRNVCGTEALLASDSFDAVPPGIDETGSWHKLTGFGHIVTESAFDSDVTGMDRGLNKFEWTITNIYDCEDTKELIINVGIPTTSNVDPDNITVCAAPNDYIELKANTDIHGEGTWTFENGIGNPIIAKSSFNITTVSNTPYNESVFRWSIVLKEHPLQCTSSDDLTITNNYIKATAGDDDDICKDWYVLQANDPTENDKPDSEIGVGKWTLSTGATGVFDDTTDEGTTITGLSSTNPNTLKWSVTKGTCTDEDEVIITNHKFKITAGDNKKVCKNSAQLDGDLPGLGNGIWTSDDEPTPTFDVDTEPDTYVRNLNPGLNTLKWTVTSKLLETCISGAEVVITYDQINVEAGNEQHICETTTEMHAVPAPDHTTLWKQTQGTPVIIVNSTEADTEIQAIVGGTYKFEWTVANEDCSVSEEVMIYNNTPQTAIATAGAENVCDNEGILLGTEPIDLEWGEWTKVDAEGDIALPNEYNTSVSGLKFGENIFKWTLYKGTINICKSEDQTSIFNHHVEVDEMPEVESFCENGDGWLYTDPPQNGDGFWTKASGTGIIAKSNFNSTAVSNLSGGENKFIWTVKNDYCDDSAEKIIINNAYPTDAYPAKSYDICEDYALIIAEEPSEGYTQKWSMGANGHGVFDSETKNITTVRELYQGINDIIWTISKDGCTSWVKFTLTNNSFTPIAGQRQIVPDPFTHLNAQGAGHWEVAGGNGDFEDFEDSKTYVDELFVGINTFTWIVTKKGCTESKDVDIIYNALVSNAGDKQIICTDTTSLLANNPDIGEGTWDIIDGAGEFENIHKYNSKLTKIDRGKNIYRWKVEKNGFSVESTVEIINEEFDITAGIDGATCFGEKGLQATDPYIGTGSWSVEYGGGRFVNASAFKTAVKELAPGQNLLVWEIQKENCTLTDTVEIFFNVPPNAEFEMDITEGCSPIDVTFTNITTGGDNYEWNWGDNLTYEETEFSKIFEAQYDKDSIYTIQLIAFSSVGCSDTIKHEVTAFRIPVVGFSAAPISQMYPNSTVNIENLSNTGYNNYLWGFGDGNTRLENSFTHPAPYTYSTWGEYEITLLVSSNQCSDTAKQTVTILPARPRSNTDNNSIGCEPLTVDFKANTLYADTYLWEFGDGSTSTEENPVHTYNVDGIFLVKLWASGDGGTDVLIRTDTINVFPLPVANFKVAPDSVMLPNQAIHCYNYSTNGFRYKWCFGGKKDSTSIEESPIHYYNKEGTYDVKLKVWTDHECFDDSTIIDAVVVEPAGVIKFPNSFTPNLEGPSDGRWQKGDISNDIFHPIYRGVLEYELEIFNRWGEKIFISKNPLKGWDGYINGKLGAQDVYVWKLSGKYKNGVLYKYSGNVTLLK